jgi:hypothetical protein
MIIMAYIRDRSEERTGYQISGFPPDSVDNHCDFVMVYGLNETTLERINVFRARGYIIHLMTGIAWGGYLDYLSGKYDGSPHWDESQTDRFGNVIAHGVNTPYMVPTVAFADYITEKLKAAVDAGVEAIHVEEPEFWDRAGYSESFKREYRTYYREDWTPPHSGVDARYKAAKLKAYLYARTIDRVSAALKEYALKKHGRNLRFYVPTHSLINYTQWKIVSPEGKLADIPGVDGCIAQVWTGTSREKNWFDGLFRERTLETAFLEYGVMQELVKGTGRHMWFLHDPIEDNPIFDWTDYRKNYLCTVVASLLHPKINRYEICPWPNRVFERKYPKDAEDAESIPPDYATILNNNFQTLGTLEDGGDNTVRVGILTADSQLYQRDYPDSELSEAPSGEVGTVLSDSDDLIARFKNELFEAESPDRELMLRFAASNAFPAFYSLALPLLKYGIPVRPVLLDNARRYAGYLDDYDILLLSYEYMKPDYPDVNNSIAEWVKRGGVLIYIGDDSDPYHRINSWWTGKYSSPAEHLFDMLGIAPQNEKGIYPCLKGIAAVWRTNPCFFGFSKARADALRAFFREAAVRKDFAPEFSNSLTVERPPYIISAVMDESIHNDPLVHNGLFADMFTPDFQIIKRKTIRPGENSMLFNFSHIENESLCIIGTSVRIHRLSADSKEIAVELNGAGNFRACIRLRTPFPVKTACIDGELCKCTYDELSRTALVSFDSVAKTRKLILK